MILKKKFKLKDIIVDAKEENNVDQKNEFIYKILIIQYYS